MNNIIRTQWLLLKKRAWIAMGCLTVPIFFLFIWLLTSETAAEGFANGSSVGLAFASALPAFLITYQYDERIQMYEIMAGFKPHQIILGRTAAYLPFTLLFLIGVNVVSLFFDNSAETGLRLVLFGVMTLRAVLGIVFLSPLFKNISFAPLFSIMLMMLGGTDPETLSHSPLSVFVYEQGLLLAGKINDGFIIKVIVSAVISCALYYCIGFVTLKRKIDLEPHRL